MRTRTIDDPETLEQWRLLGHRKRCEMIASVRHFIARSQAKLTEQCQSITRVDPAETVASELIPLCAAMEYLGRRGATILKTRKVGLRGRPTWLWGVQSRVERVPRGEVLILAAWNYPLLLAGVQAAQALAAGNRVYWKPAPGCEQVSDTLVSCFWEAGVPRSLLQRLPSDVETAQAKIAAGVDFVVLTGAAKTGRDVLKRCAETLTPATLELSGCDAVVVGRDADVVHTAKAIRFGLLFNSGATCIGPRRILVHRSVKAALGDELRRILADAPPVKLHPAVTGNLRQLIHTTAHSGVKDLISDNPLAEAFDEHQLRPIVCEGLAIDAELPNADVFAPIATLFAFDHDDEAIKWANSSAYGLAASVFGSPDWANQMAARLNVGTVTINDLLFPTADPRLPFGGRGDSGFGVTRGDEGLLEMTVPKVIATHRSRPFLHLAPRKPQDLRTLAALLQLSHGKFFDKWVALRGLLQKFK